MARNHKRTHNRSRAKQPVTTPRTEPVTTPRTEPVTTPRTGGATFGDGSLETADAVEARSARANRPHEAPDPLAHATPDAELAEAQLTVGRLSEADEIYSPEEEAELDQLAVEGNGSGGSRPGAVLRPAPGTPPDPGTPPTPRTNLLVRFIAFLRASWVELQRVQWPDRAQVMQATGVVLGFVIVAGLFLAVAAWGAGHIMTWILK